MFRGNSPARIDDKGRLKLPAGYRAAVEEKYGRELFLTSLTGEYVRVYPMPVWVEIEQKLGAMPSTHPSRLRFLDRVNRVHDSLKKREECAGQRQRGIPEAPDQVRGHRVCRSWCGAHAMTSSS